MPQHNPLPSRDWLLENLKYEPETGLVWWKKPGSGRQASKPVGSRMYQSGNRSGDPAAVQVAFGTPRKRYLLHRIIWLMVTGEDPGELTVDHFDRNPFNNRWENLRLADQSLQSRNQKKRAGAKSMHKGVHFHSQKRRWVARGYVSGERKHLGSYATEEEAAAVAAPYFIH